MNLEHLTYQKVKLFTDLYKDTEADRAKEACLYHATVTFRPGWLFKNKDKEFEVVKAAYLALINKANKASMNKSDRARNKPYLLQDFSSFEDLSRNSIDDTYLHAHAIWFIHPKVVSRFNQRFEDMWRNSSPLFIADEPVELSKAIHSVKLVPIRPKMRRYGFKERWELLTTEINYILKQNEFSGKFIKDTSNSLGGVSFADELKNLTKRQSRFGLFSPVSSRFY